MNKQLRITSEGCLTSGELADRCFLKKADGSYKSGINLDYVLWVETYGAQSFERTGPILKPTKQAIQYGLEGRIFLKTLDLRIASTSADNFRLGVSYALGEKYGAGVKSNTLDGQDFILVGRDIEPYVKEHFPHMGLIGNLTLSTLEPLPGDISREALTEMVFSPILSGIEFQKLSKAHKAFIDIYF